MGNYSQNVRWNRGESQMLELIKLEAGIASKVKPTFDAALPG